MWVSGWFQSWPEAATLGDSEPFRAMEPFNQLHLTGLVVLFSRSYQHKNGVMFQPGEGKCHVVVAWLDTAGALERPGSSSVNRRGLCKTFLSELSACLLLFELKFRCFFTQEQQDTFPLQKVLKVADTEREFGNYLYRKQQFEGAKERYKRV